MADHEPGSVTQLFRNLSKGDQEAAPRLLEFFKHRMLGLARKKLGRAPRLPGAAGDEEDAVQSAFLAVYLGAIDGKFAEIANRDELWALIATITWRKSWKHLRSQTAAGLHGQLIRPGDRETNELDEALNFLQVATNQSDFQVRLDEELEGLFRTLEDYADPRLRQIVLWKLEGLTNPQMSERLGCSLRNVTLKLDLIRRVLLQQLDMTEPE